VRWLFTAITWSAFITLSSAASIPMSNSKIMAAVCMFFL
jgi:hypothetical protein